MAKRPPIQIYTDGACRGNPGPGGYGVVMRCGNYEKEFSAGYRLTTNNRMELLAVIVGLEAIKWLDAVVTVWSDSSYVVNAVENGSVFKWEQKGFHKKANPDLWIRFLAIYRQHKVRFVWIKGHAGYPDNERCDNLAVAASMGPDLAVDEVYETSNVKNELFNNP
jgi:ribonuclease HI